MPLQVGVGGYLLGGGINFVGTSQRITTGANNVLQYTMVDARGDIYKVSVHVNGTFCKIFGIFYIQTPSQKNIGAALILFSSGLTK